MKLFTKSIFGGVAVAILCLAAITATARLGETDVEIAKRYGAVQRRIEAKTNTWKGAFLFKDYKIMVTFQTNRCVTEMLAPLHDRKFGMAEVSALREAIGGGGTWTERYSANQSERRWINPSNGVVAVLTMPSRGEQTLIVAPVSVLLGGGEERGKNETNRAEGF